MYIACLGFTPLPLHSQSFSWLQAGIWPAWGSTLLSPLYFVKFRLYSPYYRYLETVCLARRHASHITNTFMTASWISAVEIGNNRIRSESFFFFRSSSCPQVKLYRIASIRRSRILLYPQFFCHLQFSLNNAYTNLPFNLLHSLAENRKTFSCNRRGAHKMVSKLVKWDLPLPPFPQKRKEPSNPNNFQSRAHTNLVT